MAGDPLKSVKPRDLAQSVPMLVTRPVRSEVDGPRTRALRLDGRTRPGGTAMRDRSLFDSRILHTLRVASEPVEVATLRGGGGGHLIAEFYEVHLALLDRTDLSVSLPIAFADGIEDSTGNLIGLEILRHCDFALSHFERSGHIARR